MVVHVRMAELGPWGEAIEVLVEELRKALQIELQRLDPGARSETETPTLRR